MLSIIFWTHVTLLYAFYSQCINFNPAAFVSTVKSNYLLLVRKLKQHEHNVLGCDITSEQIDRENAF